MSNITQITTMVSDSLALLMEQYKGRPLLTIMLTACLNRVQEIENAGWDVFNGRMIANAYGQQIDNLATLVDAPPRGGLNDAQYLPLVLGTIASNNSDATINSVLAVAAEIYGSTQVFSETPNSPGPNGGQWPASLSLQVGSPALDPSLYSIAQQIISAAIADGVGLSYIGRFNANGAFSTAGNQPWVQGCSDLNNPSSGGGIGALIFSNTAS
jgi:hypothetical protein